MDHVGPSPVEPRRNHHPRIMHDLQETTRRHFFGNCGMGLGSIALGSLLNNGTIANPFSPRQPHFKPRAKNVIFLFMAGGPSHLDLFDWKPELKKRHGQNIPESFIKGKRFAFMNSSFKQANKLQGTIREFKQYGQCGMWASECFPHIGSIADEISLVRSCKTKCIFWSISRN